MADFQLNFIHLCDEATFSKEGKLSLIGIFDVVNLVNIPGTLIKAVLVCNFSILNPKLDSVKIDVTVTKKDEKEPIMTVPTLTAKIENKNIQKIDIEPRIGITLQLTNLQFKNEGNYMINLQVNGSLLGKYRFTVKKLIQPSKGVIN